MKKLTAGIFTVMLGLIAVDANAAITSKAYVDDAIKSVNTNLTNNYLTKTVVEQKLGEKAAASAVEALQTAISEENGLGKKVADLESSISGTDGLSGKVSALETTVGNETGGLVKDVADLQTAFGTGDNSLSNKVSALETTINNNETGLNKKVTDLESSISGTDGLSGKVSGLETSVGSLADTVGDDDSGLVKKLNDEIRARTDADDAINNTIGSLDLLTTSNSASVVGAINSLKTVTDNLANGEITSSQLGEGSVQTKNIDTDAVTTGKIQNGAVTTEKLANVDGLTAGTATKVAFNAKGQITGAEKLTAEDIPTLTADKISNLNKLASADLPASCGNEGATCVLKFDGTNYTWENIAETYNAANAGE